jgi:hypothetical protein
MNPLVLVLILVLLFGGFGGWYGYSNQWPAHYWGGGGLGLVVLVVILLLLFR